MPITRKVIQVGEARAVSLPKSWIENLEEQLGHPLTEVLMDVNDEIKIRPKVEMKKEAG
jgi:antitoxin component of MazEF toxin-antitoxin module